jgi:hypothetical protein
MFVYRGKLFWAFLALRNKKPKYRNVVKIKTPAAIN